MGDKPVLKLRRSGGVSTWMHGDDLQIEALVAILLFSLLVAKCFSSCSHSFLQVSKLQKRVHLKKIILS